MTATRLALVLALILCGCGPTTPPPLAQAEVEDFVRQYVAAQNAGDASKTMAMVQRDPSVSSVGFGKLQRGWEAIRTSTDESINTTSQFKLNIGTIDVTVLGNDAALVVAPMSISSGGKPVIVGRNLMQVDLSGALTIVAKRTPEGLRLIHEHYSVRTP